jgi:hypothetical protein
MTSIARQQILDKQQLNYNRNSVFCVVCAKMLQPGCGAAASQSVKRRLGGWCEMAASLGAMRELWDIHQLVRILAEDNVRIC